MVVMERSRGLTARVRVVATEPSRGLTARMARMARGVLAASLLVTVASLLGSCAASRPAVSAADLSGPWEHGFVELPGRADGGALRMHYLAAGTIDAPRVVLLHGFPDFSYGWREVLPQLAEDYRVLAPDLRGYGATDKPDSGYGVRELAGDIAAFIDASAEADGLTSPTPVHLIGHDWGAAVAWWVGMEHPASLRSLTALSVPHPAAWQRFLAQDAEQAKRAVYQRQLSQPGVAALLAGLGRARLGRLYRDELVHPASFSDEHLDIYRGVLRTADDWRPPLSYYQQLARTADEVGAVAAAAPAIARPVLVLWGQQDTFVYARQAPMSCDDVAPGPCELEVFEDAGHWVQWDLPDRVVQRWRAFVAGLPEG